MQTNDTARARDALFSIPADCERAAWVKTGMAYHAAGGDFDTFNEWSAPAPSYNAQACKATWRSFKAAPGGVGPGALFGMARDNGWNESHQRQEMDFSDLLKQAPKAATKPVEPPKAPPRPGMGASEVWSRCEPATNGHGYILSKKAAGVPLGDLRLVPAGDSLHIAGQAMAGSLAVPAFAPDGTIQTIQFIPAPGAGKKLNLPGANVSGAWHTVGELVPGGVVHIVEGIGQAWACWQATGHPAVVCFGAGNIGKVAAALRQGDESARLVMVPDVGKEGDAAKIAAEVGAAVAAMPSGKPSNYDASDYAQEHGVTELERLLEEAQEPPKPAPLLKPVGVGDVLTSPAPPPVFVWDGYLPKGVVSMLAAHGGTGKSTAALMLAVCAVTGRPLFGIGTEPCAVVFASLEDGANVIRHRLATICRAWGIQPKALEGRLHIVDGTDSPELFTAEHGAGATTPGYTELRCLVQSVGAGLVIVDNASDAYGADEIKRREVRAFIRSLGQIAKLANAAVLLLSHVDKLTSRARKSEGGEGYSGSTAWHNSVRSRLFLSRAEDGLLTLEHQKSNFGRLREPLELEWLPDSLPQVVQGAVFDSDGFATRQQGRADDERAAALLRLIAEFEGREQYCSPAVQARNNVHAMLKSEPAFLNLKLRPDDTKRIVNQCQRAKWLVSLDYKSAHSHKYGQRWTLTTEGRSFAGLSAPTSPTSPTCHVNDEGDEGDKGGAPTSPTYTGGTGEERAPFSSNVGESAGGENE